VELLFQVLKAIAPLFGLIVIGYLAKRFRVLHVTDSQVLNRFVVEITLPAFIFSAVIKHSLEAVYARLPIAMWIAQTAALILVFLSSRLFKLSKPQIGALMLVATFGNTGFLGYPLTTALFPARLPASVILDQFGMSLWLYPGALLLAAYYGRSGGDPKSGLLKLLRAPFFVVLIVAIVMRVVGSHVHVPAGVLPQIGAILLKTIDLIASATVPVVLLAIGLTLRPGQVRKEFKIVCLTAGIKLVAVPVVAWAVARWVLQLKGDLVSVVVLEAAMPPAATATVFAAQLEMDGALAVAAFFVLTVATAATLPLMLAVLRP
jgi:predicted permease